MHYICAVKSNEITPLLKEMLHDMRLHLSNEDIRAGLPPVGKQLTDVSPLYVEWKALNKKAQRQMERIAELDYDIQRMEPWGDYPMVRIDELAQEGKRLDFWRATRTQFEGNRRLWADKYMAELISEQDGYCYFVTISAQEEPLCLNEAQLLDVTPSPVSTLIMLQTRAKDSLRQIRLEMGDFSLQHYREVEAALGLTDTLEVPSKRRRLLTTMGRLLRKIKL